MNTQYIDTCCLFPECIHKEKAFFNYTQGSEHIQSHFYLPIHPANIHKLFFSSESLNNRTEPQKEGDGDIYFILAEKISSDVGGHVQECLLSYIRQLNFKKSEINVNEVVQRLRKKDYYMVNILSNFFSQTEISDFRQFYRASQSHRQRVQKAHLEELGANLKKMVSQFFQRQKQNMKEDKQISAFEENDGEIEQNLRLPSKASNPPSDFLQSITNRQTFDPQVLVSKDQQQVSQVAEFMLSSPSIIKDSSNEEEMSCKKSKKKRIYKNNNKKNKQRYHLNREHVSQQQNIQRSEQKIYGQQRDKEQVFIEEKQNGCIITVRFSNNPKKTMATLKKYLENCQELHILEHRLATESCILEFLQSCGRLHTLTLNCRNDFNLNLLKKISPFSLLRFKRLSIKWDMENFSADYQVNLHFPTKNRVLIQRFNRLQDEPSFRLQIPNNESLWISSSQFMKSFINGSLSMDRVRHLFISPTKNQSKSHQPNLSIKNLPCIKGLTNLTVLCFKQITFDRRSDSLNLIIKRNPNINSFMLHDCKCSEEIIEDAIKAMGNLENFEKLSLMFLDKPVEIEPKPLFMLKNLKQLYLEKINFINEVEGYKNSRQLNDIKKLTKITHLGLYACIPIFSDLFDYMNEDCRKNIKYLNLGFTSVDNTSLPYLKQMRSLEYLNIDNLNISSKNLAQTFKDMTNRFGCYSPLRYLSVEQYKIEEDQLKIQPRCRLEMDSLIQLAQYVPNLIYLDIVDCHNIEDYNFMEFTNLRTLAVDRHLYQKIHGRVNPKIEIFQTQM